MMCCFFKQKTAYEMRISDSSSDVCSSDLAGVAEPARLRRAAHRRLRTAAAPGPADDRGRVAAPGAVRRLQCQPRRDHRRDLHGPGRPSRSAPPLAGRHALRSEEHTSELQSLMRNSYAVFCLTKKKIT